MFTLNNHRVYSPTFIIHLNCVGNFQKVAVCFQNQNLKQTWTGGWMIACSSHALEQKPGILPQAPWCTFPLWATWNTSRIRGKKEQPAVGLQNILFLLLFLPSYSVKQRKSAFTKTTRTFFCFVYFFFCLCFYLQLYLSFFCRQAE